MSYSLSGAVFGHEIDQINTGIKRGDKRENRRFHLVSDNCIKISSAAKNSAASH